MRGGSAPVWIQVHSRKAFPVQRPDGMLMLSVEPRSRDDPVTQLWAGIRCGQRETSRCLTPRRGRGPAAALLVGLTRRPRLAGGCPGCR